MPTKQNAVPQEYEVFHVTNVHLIAGRTRDVDVIRLPANWYMPNASDPQGYKCVAKALRNARILSPGQRVVETRAEQDGTFHVFPGKVPGLSSSITHSFTLHPSLGAYPKPPTGLECRRCGCDGRYLDHDAGQLYCDSCEEYLQQDDPGALYAD